MMLNDVECETFNLLVTKINRTLFVVVVFFSVNVLITLPALPFSQALKPVETNVILTGPGAREM